MSALPFARLCERNRRRRCEEYQRSSEHREGDCSRKDAESEGCNDLMVIFLQSQFNQWRKICNTLNNALQRKIYSLSQFLRLLDSLHFKFQWRNLKGQGRSLLS